MTEEQKKKVLPKVVVIVGPTASGKTTWSLKLAKKYDGEIVSADSRQIYKHMDIGTAKEPGVWKWKGMKRAYFIEGIPHHLIDFLNPGKRFSVAQFRDQAIKNIRFAHKNEKLPMVVGGTGLYVSSVVDNFTIPRIPPNSKLRESLNEKSKRRFAQVAGTA